MKVNLKMHIEKINSILLAIVVIISLVLTGWLWTFQPHYHFDQNTADDTPTITIGEKREFNEVIQPIQYIYHGKKSPYGIMNHELTDNIFKTIMNLPIVAYDQIDFSQKNNSFLSLSEGTSLEMIFPIRLPINLINYIMGPIEHEWEFNYFDRIVVDLSNKNAIYYVSSTEKKAVQLKLNNTEQIENIKNQIMDNQSTVVPYFSINGKNGQVLFLPETKVMMNEITFSTQTINSSDLKNALFSDPTGVKQLSFANGEESYTDGTRALEISQSSDRMRFVNPTNQEVFGMNPEEMIMKSIEYINEHSGWTDFFVLTDWNKNDQTVQFRLTVNGHLVFQQDGQATIEQSWRENEIYEYTRSLTNLRFRIDSGAQPMNLPSGRELLSYLAQIDPNFTLNELEMVLIGYNLQKDSEDTQLVTVQPSWFIKYNGQWQQIHVPNAEDNQGGSNSGLE